jgi:hypothetical protein
MADMYRQMYVVKDITQGLRGPNATLGGSNFVSLYSYFEITCVKLIISLYVSQLLTNFHFIWKSKSLIIFFNFILSHLLYKFRSLSSSIVRAIGI